MTGRRLTAITLLLLVLGAGCSLLPGAEEEVSAACGRTMDRAEQVAALRSRVLDRTAAVTEMDPVRTVAVLAHRDEVQRAVFGPIARVATRADARADAYRRLRAACRDGSTSVPEPCRNAYKQVTRLDRVAEEVLATRMAFWSTQVRIAQRATSGDADGTRVAVDRWGDLLTEYETGVAHFDRTQIRRQQTAAACRAAL
jgi:hypothetical protein